jgi:hypothetical protein
MMYLLLSLSCIAQLQSTTNWSASVTEFKSLKRKDGCVVLNKSCCYYSAIKLHFCPCQFLKMASCNKADIMCDINVHDQELPF